MLYVIQAGESGPCKIGFSRNVTSRLSKMQSDHHEKLQLLWVFNGGPAEEQDIHARFASERIAGEWFKPHPDILAGNVGLPRLVSEKREKRQRYASALGRYLHNNRLTLAEFGSLIGACHSTVLRFATGAIFPSGPMISAIEKETKGEVTASDLHQAFAEYRKARKQQESAA